MLSILSNSLSATKTPYVSMKHSVERISFVLLVDVLLFLGVRLYTFPQHGKTCLHVAIEHDRLDVIRLLLER